MEVDWSDTDTDHSSACSSYETSSESGSGYNTDDDAQFETEYVPLGVSDLFTIRVDTDADSEISFISDTLEAQEALQTPIQLPQQSNKHADEEPAANEGMAAPSDTSPQVEPQGNAEAPEDHLALQHVTEAVKKDERIQERRCPCIDGWLSRGISQPCHAKVEQAATSRRGDVRYLWSTPGVVQLSDDVVADVRCDPTVLVDPDHEMSKDNPIDPQKLTASMPICNAHMNHSLHSSGHQPGSTSTCEIQRRACILCKKLAFFKVPDKQCHQHQLHFQPDASAEVLRFQVPCAAAGCFVLNCKECESERCPSQTPGKPPVQLAYIHGNHHHPLRLCQVAAGSSPPSRFICLD